MKHPLFSTTVLLAALAQATNALTSRAGISLQTITATSFSTVTQTSTSTFETATVTSTCAVGTAPPTVTSCVPTVWASGSNYYQQWCSSTWLHSGSAIAAFANIPYSSCVSHCLQTAECGGINFATAGAAELCYLSAGSMTISAGASYDQVMLVETKNPCVSTVTGVVASEMVVGVTTVPYMITVIETVTVETGTPGSSSVPASSTVLSSASVVNIPTSSLIVLSRSVVSSATASPSVPSSSLPSSSVPPSSSPLPSSTTIQPSTPPSSSALRPQSSSSKPSPSTPSLTSSSSHLPSLSHSSPSSKPLIPTPISASTHPASSSIISNTTPSPPKSSPSQTPSPSGVLSKLSCGISSPSASDVSVALPVPGSTGKTSVDTRISSARTNGATSSVSISSVVGSESPIPASAETETEVVTVYTAVSTVYVTEVVAVTDCRAP